MLVFLRYVACFTAAGVLIAGGLAVGERAYRWAAPPDPRPLPVLRPTDVENDLLRDRLAVVERQLAEEQRARITCAVQLDALRRCSVLLPQKPDLPASEYIPTQVLPTIPEARP